MEVIFILLIALAIDLVFGEPPDSWHPVAWVGRLISLEMKWVPRRGRVIPLVFGIVTVLLALGIVTAPLYFLFFYLREISPVIYVIVAGLLLKFTFSLRGLNQSAATAGGFLAQDKLADARTSVRSLVSRDTANLNKSQLVSATVESVAENTCDSFIAPLFYFLLFGVPGAIAYRIVNTFDAMIGYHGEWEYSGKFTARLDDVANFIPARISALLIVLAAWLCRKDAGQAWRTMLRDHKKTESPNAGWTMSAIAGALGVQLEKPGHYRLGDNHGSLSVTTIDASRQMIMMVALIWSLVSILGEVIYRVTT
ncbi:cobalamin biosynthesis protein [Chloroflexota bacterium]